MPSTISLASPTAAAHWLLTASKLSVLQMYQFQLGLCPIITIMVIAVTIVIPFLSLII